MSTPAPENLIEFHGDAAIPTPRPVPASQDMPPWLKQMPADVPAQGQEKPFQTVKKCPPFVEALSGGYLIPLVADAQFTMTAEGLKVNCELPIIESHPPEQIRGTPVEGMPVVKFRNPWIVKTPPGYSCLFVQPVNRFDLPFHILSGIVETDTYYREISFPSICLMKPGMSLTLKKGTPIVQLFPIKREAWRSIYAKVQLDQREAVEQAFSGTTGFYKEQHWRRKEYK